MRERVKGRERERQHLPDEKSEREHRKKNPVK
jgi:hypothetical protein